LLAAIAMFATGVATVAAAITARQTQMPLPQSWAHPQCYCLCDHCCLPPSNAAVLAGADERTVTVALIRAARIVSITVAAACWYVQLLHTASSLIVTSIVRLLHTAFSLIAATVVFLRFTPGCAPVEQSNSAVWHMCCCGCQLQRCLRCDAAYVQCFAAPGLLLARPTYAPVGSTCKAVKEWRRCGSTCCYLCCCRCCKTAEAAASLNLGCSMQSG